MLIKDEGPSSEFPHLRSPNHNGTSAFDNSDKCNLFSDYCCSITDLQDDDIPLPDFDDRGPNTLTDITVVEQDIIDIISLLDLNKAVGPDRISNKMLREVKYEIAGPLCLLFRQSQRDQIFPADWKLAHIIPI
jgi:hypothetical protein